MISDEFYQVFLAVIVLTMSVTPFLMSWAPRVAEYVTQRIGARSFGPPAPEGEKFQRTDHLVIIGFGINGRNLARAARAAGIDHVILEMNPDTVHRESRRGQPIVFGDGTQQTVLEQIGVRRARVIVVAISDPVATRTIVRNGRDLNPTARVIARTRYVQEVETLHKLGADEVIPEEFETSVEIFTRVLRRYLVPDDQIEKFVDEVRSDSYEIFRKPVHTSASLADLRLNLPDIEIVTLRLDSESPVVGQSLAEADLRKRYGVNLLAIRRNGNILSNPAADTRLAAGDFLILLGKPDSLRAVADQLKSTVE